jgi:hypothetical protein
MHMVHPVSTPNTATLPVTPRARPADRAHNFAHRCEPCDQHPAGATSARVTTQAFSTGEKNSRAAWPGPEHQTDAVPVAA